MACTTVLHVVRRRKVQWLVLAGLIAWLIGLFSMAVVFFWSCETKSAYAGKCKKKRKVYMLLAGLGFFPGPVHRCPIPLMDNPYLVQAPGLRTTASALLNLTYVVDEKPSNADKQSALLFGGNQTWQQREESFVLEPRKKVHCGFVKSDGPEFTKKDREYLTKCQYLVATGIFDDYDQPHQPSNISLLAQKIFCFIMLVDHMTIESLNFKGFLSEDENGSKWVGIWRVIELRNLPYDEPRRNGKLPKLLLHRLFPKVRYSIWLDGKLELVVDPLFDSREIFVER